MKNSYIVMFVINNNFDKFVEISRKSFARIIQQRTARDVEVAVVLSLTHSLHSHT